MASSLPNRIADYFFQTGLAHNHTPGGPQGEVHLDSLRTREDKDEDATMQERSLEQEQAQRVARQAQTLTRSRSRGASAKRPFNALLANIGADHARHASTGAGSGTGTSVADSEDDVPLDVLAPKLKSAHAEVSSASRSRSLLSNILKINTLGRTQEDDDSESAAADSGAVTPAQGRMKRKHPLEYKYEIATVHRYPESDHSEKERLPDGLAMFCFPNGLQFKHSPDTSLECTTHSFVITEETGAKLYGVCLLLYEPIQEPLASQLEELLEEWRADCVAGTDVEYLQHIQSQLAANQEQILRIRSGMVEGLSGAEMEDILSDAEEKVALFRERLKEMEHVAGVDMENVYVPRCVGVISRWAFYDLFADWLKVVVRMVKDTAIEDGDASAKGWSNVPLERLLVNFMDEIPLPPPGRVEVKLTIGRYNLFCSRPPVNSIQALQNFSLYPLFRSMSISHIVTLLELALAEKRMVFISSHYSMLTLACESLCLLLYPFSWLHHYFPILPASGIQLLQASFPYIAGVHKDYFGKSESLDPDWKTDVAIIDLDLNTIHMDIPPPQIPPRDRRKLIARLVKYSGARVTQPPHGSSHPPGTVIELPPHGVPFTTRVAFPLGKLALRTALSRRWIALMEAESEVKEENGSVEELVQRESVGALLRESESKASIGSEVSLHAPFQERLEEVASPITTLRTISRKNSQSAAIVGTSSRNGSMDNLKSAIGKMKVAISNRQKSPIVVERTVAMEDDDEDADSSDGASLASKSVKAAPPLLPLPPLPQNINARQTPEVSDPRKLYEELCRNQEKNDNASIMRAINSIAGSSSQPPSILDHHTALAAKRVPVNYAYSTTSSITTAPTTYNDPSIVSKSVRRSTPSLAGSVAHSSFISTTANPTRGKVKPELHEGHAFQSFSLEDPVAFSLVESPQQAVSPSPSLPDLADGHTTRSNHSMAAPTIEERRKSSRSSILNTLTRTSKSIPSLRGSQTVSPTSAGKEKSPTASENALASPAKGDAGEVQKVAASPKTLIAWKGDSNGKPEESLVCRICFDLLKQNGEMTALKCQYCKTTIHTSCLPLVEGSPCITFFNEKKIQHSFFKVFTSLLKNYRNFLVIPEKLKQARQEAEANGEKAEGSMNIVGLDLMPDDWFKKAEFLASVDRDTRAYLTYIVETQNFVQFTLERVEMPESNYEILFFDESIKAKLNRSKLKFSKDTTPFLKDGAYSIRATITALPPNLEGLNPNKTYTTSFFPLSLDKSILRTARNVKPLVTEADQNMMRSHTNDLLNRTRINNTNKRKQDFSKWMRTKLKHLQRPENRLNVEMLNDEERKDLFDEKLGIVRDCIAGYEGAHLASQTNAELHEAIEDLHIKQFLLIDMTEAELVDISDQEEFKSINIRLLHIITLYKEHLFSLENPDVNEQSLNALSPLKPREPSSSPIQPSRPQTPHINELPQMNIPVAVRSRAESLRKPRASPTNGSPRLPAASPVRPSSANDSTRGMRSPSAAFNATRSPSAATIEDSPRPPRTPSLQVADLTAAGTVFLTGSPVSPVSQVSPRPRSDSMNWSRRGSSRRSKSRDSAAGDSKSREGSVLVDGVKRAESPSETSVLREDIREEERDVRQVESPVGSSVETSPLLHTRKMAASVPGIHHIDEEGPNLVTAVADSLEESKSRSPEKIQVIRRSSSGSIQNMFASRRASLDRRSTTEKRRSSSYNRIGSETDLTDALGTSPLAASPAKVIMQRTGSNTTRRAGGILAEVISEQSPMHSVQVLDTIGRSHSLLDASLSAASLSVPCSGLPSSKRLSIAESINSILSRVEGIEVSAMPSLEKSEPVLEKGIDATVEATAGADMC